MRKSKFIFLAITLSLLINGFSINNTKGQQKMKQDQLAPLPEYSCKKVDREIKITGKLDDPLWQDAGSVTLPDAITGESGRFLTEVRALYNDDYLYVGFRCEDDYAWGTVTERDGPIWNEECVEVFLNPANVAHQYYEINVSPKNVIFDSVILNRRTADKPDETFIGLETWNPEGLVTATSIDGEADQPGKARGWSAEYAIPLDELIGATNTPPRSGDRWRVNFYRIDSPQKDQREHYAWSQTGKAAFHLPWRFGTLKFE
jgi:hypothetical protein